MSERIREDEVMDQPGLDQESHRSALRGLRRVNYWSRTAKRIWPMLRELAKDRKQAQVRVLDLACGGGDVTLALAKQARQTGLPVSLEGWDKSSTAIDFAREAAKSIDLDHVQFQVRDVLADPIEERFDAVICTLFLHHLEVDQAKSLLERMRSAAERLVVVDDLRRTSAGLWLARVGTQILSRSPVVHTDALLSVRAAFTNDEIRELAESAGLNGCEIQPHWPQRFLLSWKRS
ncbi:methyltransferase domain-containing protein [Thalassoroseus pseudoceratinae]|uniref:methyltransferase domain-containing protein n=1 Tax=Thalassoroseus pseudoceratinae TaxID=2713176 RepID=UPI001421D411|nr:methyltransferase domain-containing protein [Thalassoroseus pseudoceratinae]